jgi:hypothetical protein
MNYSRYEIGRQVLSSELSNCNVLNSSNLFGIKREKKKPISFFLIRHPRNWGDMRLVVPSIVN